MKHKILLLAISLLILAGCGRVYQVTSFSYVGDHPGEYPNESSYQDLSITYDFWAENGVMAFTVRNHLDEPINLDLSRSSFIYEDQSIPYRQSLNTVRGDQGIVTIPPQSSYRISENSLGIPEVTAQQVDLGEIIPIDESLLPYGVQFRNYLCYYRDGDAQFPSYADDGFMVSEIVLAGESAFPTYRTELSQSHIPSAYQVVRVSSADQISGTMMLIGSLFCVIVINIDEG